ncbi:MAG: hypothetical protein FWF41_00045 [Betaproteobacteria bacterium]|nr:hypothetical protein [Betaproteobacteria bacterium]
MKPEKLTFYAGRFEFFLTFLTNQEVIAIMSDTFDSNSNYPPQGYRPQPVPYGQPQLGGYGQPPGVTQPPAKKAPVKAMWIVLILAWIFFLLPLPGTGLFIACPLNLAALILAIICLTRSNVAQGVIGLVGALVISTVLFFVGGAAAVGSAMHDMDKPSISSPARPSR